MAILTLLSDLGYSDASAGIAKGVFSQYVQPHHIVDITHDIAPFQLEQAAYIFGTAWKSFPAGSVHLLLVDTFAGTTPRLVLSEEAGHYFLSPDNTLLPRAIGKAPASSWLVMELTKQHSFTDLLHTAGRIAQQLSVTPAKALQLPAYQLASEQVAQRPPSATISCNVLHTDNYENVVIDVTQQEFAAVGMGRPFRLEFMQVEELTAINGDYREVRPGYKLCRFNRNGYLEICVNKGKAASLFGLKSGSSHNNIKLIFE